MRPRPNLASPAFVGFLLLLVPISVPSVRARNARVAPFAASSLVRVGTRIPEVKVHQDIERLNGKDILEGDCRTGCTRLELQLGWNLDTTFVTFSDGESLFWISRLEVTIAYSSVEVYVSPRFKAGTCEYQAVLEHEKKHISGDSSLLEEYAAKIRAALAPITWSTYAEPVTAVSAREAREESRRQVSSVIQPLIEELQEKRRQAGEALDNAEGALQLRRICGWR